MEDLTLDYRGASTQERRKAYLQCDTAGSLKRHGPANLGPNPEEHLYHGQTKQSPQVSALRADLGTDLA
jgi:hypothetical protein